MTLHTQHFLSKQLSLPMRTTLLSLQNTITFFQQHMTLNNVWNNEPHIMPVRVPQLAKTGFLLVSCLIPLLKCYQMSPSATFKQIGNHRQGEVEVSIESYGRDRIYIIGILIPMLIQCKLQSHPNEGSCYLRGLKFCMEYFFTKPQPW